MRGGFFCFSGFGAVALMIPTDETGVKEHAAINCHDPTAYGSKMMGIGLIVPCALLSGVFDRRRTHLCAVSWFHSVLTTGASNTLLTASTAITGKMRKDTECS